MHAVIDIGTNSVLLLIAKRRADHAIEVIADEAMITRLGEGLLESGLISEQAADRTLEALGSFLARCSQESKTLPVNIVGTWALRHASNAASVVERIHRELGVDVEIISEEAEARFTYRAALHDFGSEIVVIDIGGGSTEFIARNRTTASTEAPMHVHSLPFGCVSLTEHFLHGDPPAPEEMSALRRHLHQAVSDHLHLEDFARPHDTELIATAGTAATLMAMKLGLEPYRADVIHGQRLRITDLRDMVQQLASLPLAERKGIPGLHPKRADVILAGAILLHEVMSTLGYAVVTISDRGVKWGMWLEEEDNFRHKMRG